MITEQRPRCRQWIGIVSIAREANSLECGKAGAEPSMNGLALLLDLVLSGVLWWSLWLAVERIVG